MTRTIGQLPAASGGVVSVNPQSRLLTAQSKMRANDYSQLGVMRTERDLKAVISWESIAKALSVDPDAKLEDIGRVLPPVSHLKVSRMSRLRLAEPTSPVPHASERQSVSTAPATYSRMIEREVLFQISTP